ncbi:MAG: protein-tyrosine phosphatase [Chitinophagales bacterium]|jgi:protein-tyrosine phosphatase
MKQVKVLFVCMGNICRSPTAQGVFQSLVDVEGLAEKILINSAGLHSFHIKNSPDLRSQATARGHGVELSHLSARQFFQRILSILIIC